MAQYNYYGVVGKYGIGVFNSWSRVKAMERYFQKITYHGFDTFKEAEDWTIDRFENSFPRESGKVLSLQVNCAVFVSRLRSGEER